MKGNNFWFTLVELIITITIISILWTIAFFSLANYSAQSRDAVRVSDINIIKNSLELYYLDSWKYPIPYNSFQINYWSWEIWKQWIFAWKNITNIKRLDRIPKDPLTNKEYTYSLLNSNQEYQVAWIMETEPLSFNLINSSYALSSNIKALVNWNYNWLTLKVLSWSVCDVLAIPSIISNQPSTETDILNIISNNWLVFHNQKNLPSNYNWSKFNIDWWFDYIPSDLVAYTDNDSCSSLYDKNETWSKIKLLNWLQNSYSWTSLKNEDKVKFLLWKKKDDLRDFIFWAWYLVNNWLWWDLDVHKLTPDICLWWSIIWLNWEYNYWDFYDTEIITWTWTAVINNWISNISANLKCEWWLVQIISETLDWVNSCWIDYYDDWSGSCVAVWNWYYSLNDSSSRVSCTNKPLNSTYTSDGNWIDNCSWSCNYWFSWTTCWTDNRVYNSWNLVLSKLNWATATKSSWNSFNWINESWHPVASSSLPKLIVSNPIYWNFSFWFNANNFWYKKWYVWFVIVNNSNQNITWAWWSMSEYASYVHSWNTWTNLRRRHYPNYARSSWWTNSPRFTISRSWNTITTCAQWYCTSKYYSSASVRFWIYHAYANSSAPTFKSSSTYTWQSKSFYSISFSN